MEWWGNSYNFAVGDPHFANVSLLLRGNGANGSTTILDTSPRPKTITVVGDTQISTAQSKFGEGSIAFDGNGDCLTVPASDEFNLGTVFTIEAWCRFGAVGDFAIVSSRGPTNGGFMLRRLSDNTLRLGRSLVAFDLASPSLPWSTSQFYHVAAVINGSTAYLFRDGTQVATGPNSQSYSLTAGSDTNWAIGAGQASYSSNTLGVFMNGNFNDLRITKGVARYTANFIPPTAPFPDF